MNDNIDLLVIEKYGKMKITTKDRVLVIDNDKVKYYPIDLFEKDLRKELLENQKKIRKGDNEASISIQKKRSILNDLKEKDTINLADIETPDENSDEKQKRITNSSNKTWYCYFEKNEYKFISDLIKEKKVLNQNKNDNPIQNQLSNNEDKKDGAASAATGTFDHSKFFEYLESIYQNLWKEYLSYLPSTSQNSKKPAQIVIYELAIEFIQHLFSRYCKRIVPYILSSLKVETFKEKNNPKLIPMFCPDLLNLETEDKDHYLIYDISGRMIITMTWNVVTFAKVRDPNRNPPNNSQERRKDSKHPDQETDINKKRVAINGAWGDLKSSFKTSEYAQNNLIEPKLGEKQFPVPLTCLIDYCGFRFLCEYDITDLIPNPGESKKEPGKIDASDLSKCKDDFFKIFDHDSKKEQKENYFSKQSDNNIKNNEKPILDKLQEMINDYFSNTEESKDPLDVGSAAIKYPFDSELNPKTPEYFVPQKDENLLEFPDQNGQLIPETLFKKSIYFRNEFIFNSNKKDNFKDQSYRPKSEDKGKKEGPQDNNKSNLEQSQKMLKDIYDEKLPIFLNSIDTFYYKMYDSETVAKLFHAHGINMISLGLIAEEEQNPFVKELCIIDMIARTCKKIVYHILAEERLGPLLNYIETLPSVQNTNAFNGKLPYKYKKFEVNTWSYCAHLKEAYTFNPSSGNDNYKYFYNSRNIQSTSNKNNIEVLKNELFNIDNKKEKKSENEHNKDKKAATIDPNGHLKPAKETIARFLNVFFNKTKEKIQVKGELMGYVSLWKFIKDEIKKYFKIPSEVTLQLCKLKCLSYVPFLESFEYHTGIELDWGEVNEEKNNNYSIEHFNSIEWKPEHIKKIKPRTKLFEFQKFMLNSNNLEENKRNFTQLIINRNTSYIEPFDKYMILRYYYEKIRHCRNFSMWYNVFFNELKLDLIEKNKDSGETIPNQGEKNINLESDSNKKGKNNSQNKKQECLDLYKFIYQEIPHEIKNLIDHKKYKDSNENENKSLRLKLKKKFLQISYYMISLAKEIENSPNTREFQSEKQAKELISNFYYKKNYYICDLLLLAAKELFKTITGKEEEINIKIDNYFQDTLEMAKCCIPDENIHRADIFLDGGSYYAFKKSFSKAADALLSISQAMKANKKNFRKDYFMYLKRTIKYCIISRKLKQSLTLGDALLSELAFLQNEKDNKLNEFLDKNLDYELIFFNLGKAALETKDFEKGIKYCRKLFKDKSSTQVSSVESKNEINEEIVQKKKSVFESWIKKKKMLMRREKTQKELAYEMFEPQDRQYVLKLELYLKLIIKSLTDEQKNDYLYALLRMYDSKEEQKEIKAMRKPTLEEIKSVLSKQGDLNDYFRGKIISAFKTKSKEDERDKDKNSKEKEQNADYEAFLKLYKFFGNNVFFSFLEEEEVKKEGIMMRENN